MRGHEDNLTTPTRIFFPYAVEVGSRVAIHGDEHHYLSHVLRASAGEEVSLFGFGSSEPRGLIERISKEESLIQVTGLVEVSTESHLFITLAIGVGKGRKLEEIVETTTALGVSRIVPFVGEKSVARRHNDVVLERLRRIAVGVSRQSRRLCVPEVTEVLENLGKALTQIGNGDPLLVHLDESGGRDLVEIAWNVSLPNSCFLVIGPEGGWSDHERELLVQQGAIAASLGPRILRTELAPVVTVALIERIYCYRLKKDRSQLSL